MDETSEDVVEVSAGSRPQSAQKVEGAKKRQQKQPSVKRKPQEDGPKDTQSSEPAKKKRPVKKPAKATEEKKSGGSDKAARKRPGGKAKKEAQEDEGADGGDALLGEEEEEEEEIEDGELDEGNVGRSPSKMRTEMAPLGSLPQEIPLARVKAVMKSVPEVEAISQEALAVTTRAAELFAGYFAQTALHKGRRLLQYEDLTNLVATAQHMKFLADFVPARVKFGDVKKAIERLSNGGELEDEEGGGD